MQDVVGRGCVPDARTCGDEEMKILEDRKEKEGEKKSEKMSKRKDRSRSR